MVVGAPTVKGRDIGENVLLLGGVEGVPAVAVRDDAQVGRKIEVRGRASQVSVDKMGVFTSRSCCQRVTGAHGWDLLRPVVLCCSVITQELRDMGVSLMNDLEGRIAWKGTAW